MKLVWAMVVTCLAAGCTWGVVPADSRMASLRAGAETAGNWEVVSTGEEASSVAGAPRSFVALASYRAADSEAVPRPFLTAAEEAGGAAPEGEADTEDIAEVWPLSPFSIRGGFGFTADPSTFLLAGAVDYFVNEQFAIGPLLQAGISDNRSIVAPTLNLQYFIDLTGVSKDGALRKLRPLLQGGVGFAYIHKDIGSQNTDELGFLLNLGFGLEYDVTQKLALGSNMLFNILPHEVAGENFFFSWQVLGFRLRF